MANVKQLTEKTWNKQKAKLSVQFDLDCYKIARAFLAIQSRAILNMQNGEFDLTQKEMNQMILSMKKAQEMCKCAFGEVIEATQMKLDLRVVYDDPKE